MRTKQIKGITLVQCDYTKDWYPSKQIVRFHWKKKNKWLHLSPHAADLFMQGEINNLELSDSDVHPLHKEQGLKAKDIKQHLRLWQKTQNKTF